MFWSLVTMLLIGLAHFYSQAVFVQDIIAFCKYIYIHVASYNIHSYREEQYMYLDYPLQVLNQDK